jgi:hypothetical protein
LHWVFNSVSHETKNSNSLALSLSHSLSFTTVQTLSKITEVLLETYNGAWIGNVYLPNPNDVPIGSKFQITVSSTWGVNVHYNDGFIEQHVDNREQLIVIVFEDDVDGRVWFSEQDYIPPPTDVPTSSPTPSPTSPDEKKYELLEGTVLFAQSQIIPSKHGIEDDNQPHLTALRKTLVMLRPHNINFDNEDIGTEIEMIVRNGEGGIIQEGIIAMNDPSQIPKQSGWIEFGDNLNINDIEMPISLDGDRYIIQGQTLLTNIGYDTEAVKIAEILNDEAATVTNQNQVEIKTSNGSWVRDIYLPTGLSVPSSSIIQITCNSGYNVNLYYPNTQTGIGYRKKIVSNGQTLVAILVDNGSTWITKDDLIHNEYVFGHNFYTATLDAEWIVPGMTLEFIVKDDNDSINNKQVLGILDDINVGGVTELMITTLDVGMLTEPRNKFLFANQQELHREYYETTLASRLIVVQYESMFLEEIMLPDGTFYSSGGISNTDGSWHTGDMRQFIAKILLSHGIDLANYGVSSSLGSSESSNPFTCALLAAHNAVGMYQNGRKVHGGSGGNGMVTLDSSIGNEFSHEIGHNYNLGHYVDGFNGSVHRPSNEINSSWGWDSTLNVFIPNFSSSSSGKDQCLDEQCQTPFLNKYQYGKDSMAGGSPQWTNHYTMYTPNSAKKIQDFLEKKAIWDPTSSTGFSKYDGETMKEFNGNQQQKPRLYRVPVTTLVGYYDPDSTLNRNLQSYIYPAMHGAYGFVYNDDGDSISNGCKLVVETSNNGVLVYDLSTSIIDSNGMNKFHVNIATDDEPYDAKIFCQNMLRANRVLLRPKHILEDGNDTLTYTVTGIPFADNISPASSPTSSPTSSLTSLPTSSPTTDNSCKDSTDSFKWNKRKRKRKTCKWLRKKSDSKIEKLCKKRKQRQKVWVWCPTTCGNVGIGPCTTTVQQQLV